MSAYYIAYLSLVHIPAINAHIHRPVHMPINAPPLFVINSLGVQTSSSWGYKRINDPKDKWLIEVPATAG